LILISIKMIGMNKKKRLFSKPIENTGINGSKLPKC
jgi:hypothetical protein